MGLADNQVNQKSNLLSVFKNFEKIGLGVKNDGENSLYVVIVFIET